MAQQKIAFIGLGIMGLPMAKNLVNAGFEVIGYNRSPEKAQELASAGGSECTGSRAGGSTMVLVMGRRRARRDRGR